MEICRASNSYQTPRDFKSGCKKFVTEEWMRGRLESSQIISFADIWLNKLLSGEFLSFEEGDSSGFGHTVHQNMFILFTLFILFLLWKLARDQ